MTRILRGEELQDKAYAMIETATAVELQAWHDALREVADPEQRTTLENAAIGLAGAWLDQGILVGWQMRADPGKWLFVETET